MKYLVILLLSTGCTFINNPHGIRVGMKVTNGYCQGIVQDIFITSAYIKSSDGCAEYSFFTEDMWYLKEVK